MQPQQKKEITAVLNKIKRATTETAVRSAWRSADALEMKYCKAETLTEETDQLLATVRPLGRARLEEIHTQRRAEMNARLEELNQEVKETNKKRSGYNRELDLMRNR